MLTALIEFIHRLRNAAIPISMVEALDAAHALRHIDLGSRAELKAALAAVLVKRAEHRAPFAALFDISFVPRRAEVSRPAGAPATLSPPLPADLTEAAVGEGGSEDLSRLSSKRCDETTRAPCGRSPRWPSSGSGGSTSSETDPCSTTSTGSSGSSTCPTSCNGPCATGAGQAPTRGASATACFRTSTATASRRSAG